MTDRFSYSMPWGAQWANGRAVFHLWAPAATEASVQLDDRQAVPMHLETSGRFRVELPCEPNDAYQFTLKLSDGQQLRVADPASRLQQGDVDDASLIVDPSAYCWQHPNWRGRSWHQAVIYELHVGLLGGFAGVTQRLPGLAALGVTAIELMPVADFPGPRNWGYDGVLPFAPDAAYGTPEELKRLIDTAHGLGLMVLLDVVYNHFGPDGNYLPRYAPSFFHSASSTAWGGAIDFSQPEVRSFFISNAIYWIEEYRFDGLRIDAAHAIAEQDWLPEMAQAVRAKVGRERSVHLVLEHDGNAAGLLKDGFDAQWNDDAHHVLHTLLTREVDSYYTDYAEEAAKKLARVLSEGFIYQGDPSRFRGGEKRGEPSADLSPTAFVLFLQNHDQTGNRAFGERLSVLTEKAALRAAQAMQLLTPHIPLIFMGEESQSTEPFLYFTSHRTPELAEAVRKGRWQEFAATKAFADEKARETIPNPNDESTFERSRPARIGEQDDVATAFVKDLLAIRAARITPHLRACKSEGAEALAQAAVKASWHLGPHRLTLLVNLATEAVDSLPSRSIPPTTAETLFDTGGVRKQLSLGILPPHACIALLEHR